MPPKKKIPKRERPHRPCPTCHRTQPGTGEADAPHKPGGLKRRRERRSELPAESAKTSVADGPVRPDPIDAMTVIRGVTNRIPKALEDIGTGEMPSSGAFAAAVRRAVLDEFRTRAQFTGRLAEIDALLRSRAGGSPEAVASTMSAHLRELRLLRVTEPEESDRFVVTEGEGDAFELLSPAYVDELTGKVVLAGQLRRVAGPAGTNVGEEA
ncbi:hypothetical protein ACFXGI_24895 [Streptomyces sp. NPDC059355]|uniref:hypothetical protein n=1 Tax=Streptomyces sp. NPDC059355 TaxID=3346811 RepID=UPI0036B0FDBC